ncbi:MAG: prolyl oligopeptidase family serine peptidase [Parasporobacterium sp.]|nr:prolyl oligopeptidase family serine peptidase [Parasporobacterium sp.]
MIKLDCSFQSIILRTQVNVKVYLPNPEDFMHPVTDFRERYTFKPFKTLFLLHGMMDSAEQWVENTSITRLAQEEGIALVIPSCGNNFYVNTIYGARYSDFITEELIGFVRGLFPLSDKREDNYIWGISMGGYGALRQGFVNNSLFSRVIAMSPTTDIEFTARFAHAMGVDPFHVIGSWKDLPGSDLDLQVMAQKAAEHPEKIPPILVIIADQDHMVRDNTLFRDTLDRLGIRNEFRTYPGDHTWGFWDSHVEECIRWLCEDLEENPYEC